MIIGVLHKHRKFVIRRLTAHHVKFRKLVAYWDWQIQAFDVPEESVPLISSWALADPDAIAGCTFYGGPLKSESKS